VYLAFYVLGHMDSVFIFARTYLGMDSGWVFATGAPTGLIMDPWNIRLVPHYWLAVFFVLAHLASGAREPRKNRPSVEGSNKKCQDHTARRHCHVFWALPSASIGHAEPAASRVYRPA
jgi:hypothetical protein